MGKYSRLGKNTILVFLGNAGSKLISLIMLPFYTRWLSVEEYGLTDILGVYVSLLIGVVSCSIGEALFIYPKGVDSKQKREYFSTGIIFMLVMMVITAIVFYICGIVGVIRNISNSFFDYLWLIYSMIFCMLVQQTTQQFIRSLDKMVIYSITGIVVTICTAIYSFVFIPTYGVFGYVFSLNLANITGALYCLFASGANKYFSFHVFSIPKFKEMLRYSIPLIPNSVMWWLVGALNRPIMEASVGLEGVGIFAVANKFPGLLSMLLSVFVVSWQISVIEEYGKEGFEKFYNNIVRLVVVGVIVIFFTITLMSKLLVMLFTTPDYYDAWRYIPLLTLGAVFSTISSLCGALFSAIKQSKYVFYSSVWGGGVALVSNFLLIPQFGLFGAAVTVLMSFIAMSLSRVIYAWRYVHILDLNKYYITLLLALMAIAYSLYLSETGIGYIVGVVLLMLLAILFNLDILREAKIMLSDISIKQFFKK